MLRCPEALISTIQEAHVMDMTKAAMAVITILMIGAPFCSSAATNHVNHNARTATQVYASLAGKMNRELQLRIDANLQSTVDLANRDIPATSIVTTRVTTGKAEKIEDFSNSLAKLIGE